MMRTPDDDKAKAASIPPAARALFSWASAKEGAGEAPPAAVRFQSPPQSGGLSSGTSEIGGVGIEGSSEVGSGAAREEREKVVRPDHGPGVPLAAAAAAAISARAAAAAA